MPDSTEILLNFGKNRAIMKRNEPKGLRSEKTIRQEKVKWIGKRYRVLREKRKKSF